MKVKVTSPFRDKFNLSHTFNVGEVLDFPEERVNDIVKKGLGEIVPQAAPKAEPKAASVEAVAPKPRAPRTKKTK